VQELSSRNAFRKTAAKSPRASRNCGRRKVVKVVQNYVFLVCAARSFPFAELGSDAGIVFYLAERIEADETRNHHDVNARIGRRIVSFDRFNHLSSPFHDLV
jgi:hypothetical protein